MGALTTIFGNPMLTGLAHAGAAGATGAKVKANAAPDGTGSGTPATNPNSMDNIGTTFLSLLVQELQNQDPTAPMDSTQMVGQMISLNQLDQLTGINQTLTTAYGTTASTSGTGGSPGTGSTPHMQAMPETQTAAALRLMRGGAVSTQPRVSTSVTLPAF